MCVVIILTWPASMSAMHITTRQALLDSFPSLARASNWSSAKGAAKLLDVIPKAGGVAAGVASASI